MTNEEVKSKVILVLDSLIEEPNVRISPNDTVKLFQLQLKISTIEDEQELKPLISEVLKFISKFLTKSGQIRSKYRIIKGWN